MKRSCKKLAATFIAAALVSLTAGVAFADDISNDLDTSIDATAEALALTVGGSNGSVGLYVNPTGSGRTPEDGKSGCNLTAGSTVVVAVTSSDPTKATVSPSSITFTSCGDTPTITVTPVAVGSPTVSLSQTSNTTGGTFNFAPATFTVNVSAPPATDSTPPSISYVLDPATPDGLNGWYRSAVSLTWTVTEDESPDSLVTTDCVNQNVTADQAATSYSCSATSDGGSAGPVTVTIKRDATAPSVSCGTADSIWHASDVSIGCTGSDGLSLLADSADAAFNLVTSVPAGSETANASTNSRTVYDNAGNSTVAGPISGNKIDKKAPTDIAFVGGIDDGDSYYFGFVPAAPTCTAGDGGSGLESCTVSGYSNAVGPHTLTATATDEVGNVDTAQIAYTVQVWTLSGFYQPVDMNAVNTVKGGSTVPFKFEIFAGSTELTDTSRISSLKAGPVSCTVLGDIPTDAIEATATGGTSLRYDTTSGQYIYNWQTPKQPGVCYRVVMTTQDGSTLSALFKLK